MSGSLKIAPIHPKTPPTGVLVIGGVTTSVSLAQAVREQETRASVTLVQPCPVNCVAGPAFGSIVPTPGP